MLHHIFAYYKPPTFWYNTFIYHYSSTFTAAFPSPFVATILSFYTHPFNGPFFGTTQVSQYQKGKTNLDFTEARDSEWQWHQLGRMQVCTSLQTDNHSSTPPLSFLQAGCPSYRPTNSIKALKAHQSTEGSTPSTYVYNTPTQLLYRPTLYPATLQPATTSKT